MDSFFSGLDSRLRAPVKAADSIMVGLVNTAMEDAYRKSLWKDGDLDRLFHKLRFAELAVMQLDWCLRFVRGEMSEADGDGHEELLDDLLETRDRIQARLDEAELAVAEADRDYMRRRREEFGGPTRGSGEPTAAARRGGAEYEEDGARSFGELSGSVSRMMSRMRARLEDASSTLAALMERMSGEASPMARLQESGHEGEGVKGLSGFYSVAQLLMEFQEMVMDAGAVRDIVASSFDAMEGSVSALRSAMDERQWLMDAEREMYSAVVEGFLREINVGSNHTSSPGEGARTTWEHDGDATENCLEKLLSPKDETMRLQSEESDSRQCYHSEEQFIYREEAERLAEEKIDSDVRSELQRVLYTAAFRNMVKKLAVLDNVQRVTEQRDEVDIRIEVQNEIYSTIVKNLLKGMTADSVDHIIKTSINDEVHAVFLKTLNSWKSTTDVPHSERLIKEEIDRIVFGGLVEDLMSGHNVRAIKSYDESSPRNNLGRFSMIDDIKQLKKIKMEINVTSEDEGADSDQHGVPLKQEILNLSANCNRQNCKGSDQEPEISTDKRDVPDSVKNDVDERLEDQSKAQTEEIGVDFSVPPENGNKEMFIPSTKFQEMFMNFEAVTCGKLGTAVLRFVSLHSIVFHDIRQLDNGVDPCPD